METIQNQFYRDQFRAARAVTVADSEGFHAVLHALELLGAHLTGEVQNLGKYEAELSKLADLSALSTEIPTAWPRFHTKFCALYTEFRTARNDAVHQGSYARTMTGHAVELSIVLEDALMAEAAMVSQFMVREVVQAEPWQPISYVRQQMLKHAFSYIPIHFDGKWQLIPEYGIARILRAAGPRERRRLLAFPIDKANSGNGLSLLPAKIVRPEDQITQILQDIGERPILVSAPEANREIVGVLTSSDIL